MTTSARRMLIPTLGVTLLTLASCSGSSNDSADTTAANSVASSTSTAPSTTASASAPTTTQYVPPATQPDATPPEDPTIIEVTVGVDSAADRIEPVALGTEVTLIITNPDTDDEFHLHGYDLGDGISVPAGQPSSYTFTASKPGDFELESHNTDVVLLILRVQ